MYKQEIIARVEEGCYREYLLQYYIINNYKKLGFGSIETPLGCVADFEGVYKGERVVIEAERRMSDFVKHKHDPKEIDILIVFGYNKTNRKSLPKKIIKVDAEDFLKETREVRKRHAILTQEKQENIHRNFKRLRDMTIEEIEAERFINRFINLKETFVELWYLFVEEVFYKKPSEMKVEMETLSRAINATALKYCKNYRIDPGRIKKATKIEVIINPVRSYQKAKFDDLSKEDQAYLKKWHRILRDEYAYRESTGDMRRTLRAYCNYG